MVDIQEEIAAGNCCMKCHAVFIGDDADIHSAGHPAFCEPCWDALPEHEQGGGVPYFSEEASEFFNGKD